MIAIPMPRPQPPASAAQLLVDVFIPRERMVVCNVPLSAPPSVGDLVRVGGRAYRVRSATASAGWFGRVRARITVDPVDPGATPEP